MSPDFHFTRHFWLPFAFFLDNIVSQLHLFWQNVICVSWNQKEAFMSKVWLTASSEIMNTFICQRPNYLRFQLTVYPKAALLFAWLNNKPCNNIVKYTSLDIRGSRLPMIQLSNVVRGSKSTFYIQFSWTA